MIKLFKLKKRQKASPCPEVENDVLHNQAPVEPPEEERQVQPSTAHDEAMSLEKLSAMVKEMDFNIRQLSRQLTALAPMNQSGDKEQEAIYRRLLFQMVDMPIRLYERTSRRLLARKEQDASFDITEMRLVLSFLQRHLRSLGLDLRTSQLGTPFDPDTMEVDDEHDAIDVPGGIPDTVACSVVPRMVWLPTSGMPEVEQRPEKVILVSG